MRVEMNVYVTHVVPSLNDEQLCKVEYLNWEVFPPQCLHVNEIINQCFN